MLIALDYQLLEKLIRKTKSRLQRELTLLDYRINMGPRKLIKQDKLPRTFRISLTTLIKISLKQRNILLKLSNIGSKNLIITIF